MIGKAGIKRLLGELPLTAEAYWLLRQGGRPLSKSFSLKRVEKHLPEWTAAAQAARERASAVRQSELPGKRVMVFATLLYWLEHTTLLSLALAGLGHDVTLTYLPYANWRKPFNRFDLRRQNAYARSVLRKAAPVQAVSLLTQPAATLPPELAREVAEISLRDVQYTLQLEDVSTEGSGEDARLYRLRLERNRQAAAAALSWMQSNRPEVVITPNGSILELGAVYAAARHLNIPVVTYEFGEQRGRIWFAQNGEVMRQETGSLWAARRDTPLDEAQWEQAKALFASRQKASLWENFARQWQGQPSQGGAQVRQSLGLDARPVALLAANVIGDSLTLGRQVFSASMTEWLARTVQYFAGKPEVQLVVRIHPGERYTKGPSVADLVRRTLPELPQHIHLVEAADPTNTYDLVEIADLGMVYTTTVGMEMAMSGVPVVVSGQTHYRQRGFSLDPISWDDYFAQIETVLSDPAAARLSRPQWEAAWNYAYRFFFEFPRPFPWHLLDYWAQLEAWPMERVLSPEGQAEFGETFRYLVGEPLDWAQVAPASPLLLEKSR